MEGQQRMLTVTGAALALVIAFLSAAPAPRPVFSGEAMLRVAREALAANETAPEATLKHVIAVLRRDFGRHVVTDEPWVLNNAGGAMGAFKVLHFSLSEYVILFGTAVGTEGHTGRFMADDYFTMLYGEQWAFKAGNLRKEVYRAGDQHVLARGEAKQYRMPDEAWALEYAHGNMLAMMPFGLADALFSTLDFTSVYQTANVAVRGIFRELSMGKV